MNTLSLINWMPKINEYVDLMTEVVMIRKAIDKARSDAVSLGKRGGRMKQLIVADLGAIEIQNLMRPLLKVVSPSEVSFVVVLLQNHDLPVDQWEDPTTPLAIFNESVWCQQQVRQIEAVMQNIAPWSKVTDELEAKAKAIEVEVRPHVGTVKWDYFVKPALEELPPFGYRIESVPALSLHLMSRDMKDMSTFEKIQQDVRNSSIFDHPFLNRLTDLGVILVSYQSDKGLHSRLRSRPTQFNTQEEARAPFLHFESGLNAGHSFDRNINPMNRPVEEKINLNKMNRSTEENINPPNA